jgi:hypothetical protein
MNKHYNASFPCWLKLKLTSEFLARLVYLKLQASDECKKGQPDAHSSRLRRVQGRV